MKQGEKRKIEVHCAKCKKLRILRASRNDPPFSPDEVAQILQNYVCSDCTGISQLV